MRIKTLLILITLLLNSCSIHRDLKIIESGLIGNWTIDSLYVKDHQSMTVKSNIITFQKNGEFIFPDSNEITWKLSKDSDQKIWIKFISNSPQFNNNFNLYFKKDSINKLLKLYLVSESIDLDCSKMLFNYDNNLKAIEKLIMMTHK